MPDDDPIEQIERTREHLLAQVSELEAPSQSVSLRETHPNLYKAITVYGLVTIGLGLNFLFLNPTFNPFNISTLVGVVFVVIGVAKLMFLNLFHNLRLVRIAMAIGVGSLFFYGAVLTVFYFQTYKTSLQLPIAYVGLSILQLTLLIEPPSNPVSGKNGNGKPSL